MLSGVSKKTPFSRPTIKEATVRRFRCDNFNQLRTDLTDFSCVGANSLLDCRLSVLTYNFFRKLKTLNGLIPFEYICKVWTSEREKFILNPIHQMQGLYT